VSKLGTFREHYTRKLAGYLALLTIVAFLTVLTIFFGRDMLRFAGGLIWEASGGKAVTETVTGVARDVRDTASRLSGQASEAARSAAARAKETVVVTTQPVVDSADWVWKSGREGAGWVRQRGSEAVKKTGEGYDWLAERGGKALEKTNQGYDWMTERGGEAIGKVGEAADWTKQRSREAAEEADKLTGPTREKLNRLKDSIWNRFGGGDDKKPDDRLPVDKKFDDQLPQE
jgi:hypothetical protein